MSFADSQLVAMCPQFPLSRSTENPDLAAICKAGPDHHVVLRRHHHQHVRLHHRACLLHRPAKAPRHVLPHHRPQLRRPAGSIGSRPCSSCVRSANSDAAVFRHVRLASSAQTGASPTPPASPSSDRPRRAHRPIADNSACHSNKSTDVSLGDLMIGTAFFMNPGNAVIPRTSDAAHGDSDHQPICRSRISPSSAGADRTMSPMVTGALPAPQLTPLPSASTATAKNFVVSTNCPAPMKAARSSDLPENHVGNNTALDRSALSVPNVRYPRGTPPVRRSPAADPSAQNLARLPQRQVTMPAMRISYR